MRQIICIALALCLSAPAFAWSPKGDKIKTRWAAEVTPQNAWQAYPRPQLQRADWQNLNGLWNYEVTGMDAKKGGVTYGGEILVPFAIESSLSGVQQPFAPTDKLWYRRTFAVDPSWKGRQVILHFGAVDYQCSVWINNKLAGTHTGGNNPFSFDITRYLKGSGNQTLEVSVTDPTDSESVTRGKQQLNQQGIWYTPVSGIWQTVWLEPVGAASIARVLPQADIRKQTVSLKLDLTGSNGRETVKVKVLDGEKVIATAEQAVTADVRLHVPGAVLWSPETPHLYGLEISLVKNNREVDHVKSYFAMREVSHKPDEMGYQRICLNGDPIFQYGTLDQGWWPDGLLTPPSPEAMLWDMVQLKQMGFNTIRKHIKVEPALYYYYADSLGLMMWQDMPSGFATARKDKEHIRWTDAADWDAPAPVAKQFLAELDEMIDDLRFFPCITTWVVFNEGWGQHNTREIVTRVMDKDPSRLVNGVTGWTDRGVGHMYDVHNYPATAMMLPSLTGGRISVLGEFGGLGLPLESHLWNPQMRNWGYKNIEGGLDLMNDYGRLMFDLQTLIAQGLSAAIYTQTTDVEGEVNGLITYDRETVKMPEELLHILHSQLYKVKPVRPVNLIPDAREGTPQPREITIDGVAQRVTAPYEIKGEKTVYARQAFTADKPYANLSLYLNVRGKTTVRLNGVTILDIADSRLTRSYNQYNISSYSNLLRQGANTLEVEVGHSGNTPMKFDFGLKAY